MKVALVGTHGGHLLQIIQLLGTFTDHDYFFAILYSSRDKEFKEIGRAYFTDNIGTNPVQLALGR